MIVFFSDRFFSNSKILFLRISKCKNFLMLLLYHLHCFPIGTKVAYQLSALQYFAAFFLLYHSSHYISSFPFCSFDMVFVAVSLAVVITSVSSRIIASSVVMSSGVFSLVSGNNTVASLTLSVFTIL